MDKEFKDNLIINRMARRGLKSRDIKFCLAAWAKIHNGLQPVNWQEIEPLDDQAVKTLPATSAKQSDKLQSIGLKNLHQCAVIKLNGGRSTTMGGKQPKCMVTVKNDMNFLDISMHQLMRANDEYGVEVPLVLMNSFFTDHVTEKIIGKTPLMILNFIQNEFPRIMEKSLQPLDTGTDADWCPAGHGDFYLSLESSGMLDSLLDLGLRYAFISNIDNLSATLSPRILGMMIDGGHDFIMEVTRKTQDDIKGGAPVIRNGKLSLLEIAQVAEDDRPLFMDTSRFPFFNTNNLWVDLLAVKKILVNDRLQLPVIVNRKNIEGRDIIQIETAMGAAMESFNNSILLEVDRSRFDPVKTMEDLLTLRSDLYIMNEDYRISKKLNISSKVPAESL
jgi:UTP--glucose-1-phosphate uridylyltransferase